MNVRKKAREVALQTLYKYDIAEGASEGARYPEMDELVEGTEARSYCERLVDGVMEEKSLLDGLIERHSENWTIERMPVVDRNILRIAVYEFKHEDVPYRVVIDQAIELAKKYGSEESGAFINGVLDNVGKNESFGNRH